MTLSSPFILLLKTTNKTFPPPQPLSLPPPGNGLQADTSSSEAKPSAAPVMRCEVP